jgi:hypothetical protein
MNRVQIEPIKTALVNGDHALARHLRTQLFREIIEELANAVRFNGIYCDLDDFVEQADSLGIQEER